LALRRRSDGYVSTVFNVTGFAPREFEKMWDGLVRQVDFETWEPVFEPERRDDQTVEDWLG
jgi:hypothetical protein